MVAKLASYEVQIIELETEPIRTFHDHQALVNGIYVFKDKDRILTWSMDATVRVWSVTKPKVVSFLFKRSVYHVKVLPDETAFIASAGSTISYVNIEDESRIIHKSLDHREVMGFILINDYKSMVFWTEIAIYYCSLKDNTKRVELNGHKDEIKEVKQQDEYLYSSSYDTTIKKWKISTAELTIKEISPRLELKCELTFIYHKGVVNGFTFDNNYLYSWSKDNRVIKWDPFSGGLISCYYLGLAGKRDTGVNYCFISSCTNRVVAVREKEIYVFNQKTEEIQFFLQLDYNITNLLTYKDSQLILCLNYGSVVICDIDGYYKAMNSILPSILPPELFNIILDYASHLEAVYFKGHMNDLYGAYINEERRLISWGKDRTAIKWNLESDVHELSASNPCHRHHVKGFLDVGRDRVISYARTDLAMFIWSISSEENPVENLRHIGSTDFKCLAKIDSNYILSWDMYTPPYIWSLSTGESLPLGDIIGGSVYFNEHRREEVIVYGKLQIEIYDIKHPVSPVLKAVISLPIGWRIFKIIPLYNYKENSKLVVFCMGGIMMFDCHKSEMCRFEIDEKIVYNDVIPCYYSDPVLNNTIFIIYSTGNIVSFELMPSDMGYMGYKLDTSNLYESKEPIRKVKELDEGNIVFTTTNSISTFNLKLRQITWTENNLGVFDKSDDCDIEIVNIQNNKKRLLFWRNEKDCRIIGFDMNNKEKQIYSAHVGSKGVVGFKHIKLLNHPNDHSPPYLSDCLLSHGNQDLIIWGDLHENRMKPIFKFSTGSDLGYIECVYPVLSPDGGYLIALAIGMNGGHVNILKKRNDYGPRISMFDTVIPARVE